jgi:hypothetical protein
MDREILLLHEEDPFSSFTGEATLLHRRWRRQLVLGRWGSSSATSEKKSMRERGGEVR